ncbi:MAG: hypothetical protein ACAH80_16670 [Alphaproteobacteria bacterium]
MKIAIAAFALVLTLFVAPVFAATEDPAAKPSKESLLAAWEQAIKASAYTVKFEKVKENVYDYETTIFPFKGELTLLNLYISDRSDYYGSEVGDSYYGTAEVVLAGVDRDFKDKYETSYNAWDSENVLTYGDRTKKWYSSADWEEYKSAVKAEAKKSACSSSENAQQESGPTLFGVLLSWFPMLLLIGVWVFFARSMRKGVTNVNDVHKKSLEWMDKTEKLLEELVLIQKQKK